jgi:hypothetical protein
MQRKLTVSINRTDDITLFLLCGLLCGLFRYHNILQIRRQPIIAVKQDRLGSCLVWSLIKADHVIKELQILTPHCPIRNKMDEKSHVGNKGAGATKVVLSNTKRK